MTRSIAFFGLVVLAVGCGGGKDGKTTPEKSAPAGKPASDEAPTCLVAYLNQCGWEDVELAQGTDQPKLPAEAKEKGDAWAFAVTAPYTNVFGGTETSAKLIAVGCR